MTMMGMDAAFFFFLLFFFLVFFFFFFFFCCCCCCRLVVCLLLGDDHERKKITSSKWVGVEAVVGGMRKHMIAFQHPTTSQGINNNKSSNPAAEETLE